MQYNKHNIQKVNDKKLMRKVKKQWVVLSVSAFASLGAAAFWMLNPDEVSANSDTTPQALAKTPTGTSVGRSDSAQQQSTNTLPLGSGSQPQGSTINSSKVSIQSKQPVSETDKAQSDWNNGQKDSGDNNSDYTKTYSNSTQGFTEAMNNDQKNIVQSQNNNTPSNPNPQKQDSGYQNGVNQYNQYRSAMDAGASDAYNGSNANTSSQNSTQAKNYYTAAYNGSNDAKTAYTNATKNEGTDDKSYTSYNQWLKDNNKDQTDTPSNNKSNAQAYQQNLDGNLNNSSNNSVKTNARSIQVTNNSDLNQASNQKTYQASNNYPDGSAYALAYQYGYNYFLANQGAADAKSGKWSGKNSNGYKPSSSSKNPYDQAYLGAQAAIQKQVYTTQNGTSGVSISNYSGNSNTSTYQSAYNDVANSTQNGTVYLTNSNQMDNVLQKNISNVKSLRLVNDIGYSDTSAGNNYPQNDVHLNTNALDIDGQNHILDMTNNSYTILPANANTKINIHNFKTIYGSNYYGPFALDNNGSNSNNNTTSSITYSNVNYVGSKLLSAYYSNAYINGNVNVDAVDYYNSPFNTNIQSQTDNNFGNGNYQENLQVNSMILGANANYFGNASMSSQSGSTVIQLLKPNSALTLGKNSTMTLVPTGATSGENSPDNNAYGINMSDTNPTLNVNEGATLNIFPNTDYGNHVAGIYNTGTINVNGGKINAEVNNDFASGNNQLINTQGQVNVTNGGLINVKVSGLTAGSSGLIQNSNNINVSNLGNLSVQDLDSSSNPAVNLISGNAVNVYNVGNQGVTLITNGNPSSKFSTGGINAYTVVVSTDPNNKNANAYYNFNMQANNNTQANVLDSQGKTSTLPINSNSLYINSVPSAAFVGPIYTTTDGGVTTIHGYARISKYSSNAGPLYIQYAYGNGSTYTSLTPFSNQSVPNTSTYDSNKYYISNNNTNTGDLIPLSYTVPSGINASSYGIRLRYGVSGINSVVTNSNGSQSYTASTEGYSFNNNKLQENDVQSASGSLNSSNDGINAGLSDIKNNSSNGKDPTRYQKDLAYTDAYDNVQSGYQYYLNNSNDPNHQENPNMPLIPQNVASPAAFVNGYTEAAKDANSGYKESLNGNNINGVPSSSDNVGTKYGFAQGQSVLQGISDANTNPNQGSSYSGNAIQNTAYQAAVKAITDGMNNNPMTSNDLNNKPQVYQDAYNMAYKTANDLSKQIASGNVDPSTLTPAQQAAYNNSPQAVSKSTEAAKNPTTDSDNKYNGTDNASRAYQAAQAGYANGGTGSMTTDQKNDSIYNNAFTKAQQAAQTAAKSGASQFTNGQPNNPTEGNAAEKAADTYGYQQAEKGYDAAKGGTADKNNSNPSYQAGVQMNTDVNNGINDANKASTQDPNYAKNHNTAQTAGYNGSFDGIQAGMNGDKPADVSKQPQAYQDAYNKAFNSGKQIAQQIAGGNLDPSTLTPAQQAAYNNSPQAVSKSTEAAKNPTTDSDNKYSGTDNASRAYQGAQAGYANGGTGSMTTDQQNDPIYNNAFTKAQQAAQTAAKSGASQFTNGQPNNPTEGNAAEKAADTYGYQQAEKGYDAAKAGNTTNPTGDPSYQAGVQMNTDVNNGINDANKASTKDSSYANNHNAAQTAGYNGSFDGTQAGMSNQPYPSMNGKSQAYQDAYKQAYDAGQKAAQQIAGGNLDPSKLSPAQQTAQQAAQAAMDQANTDAKANDHSKDSQYQGNTNADKTYQAAQAGYANGGTGSMTTDQKNDPIYNNAFTKAQQAAQTAAKSGASQFTNGQPNTPTEGSAAEKAADTYGYNQAQAGYNAAKGGTADKNNSNPSYQAGVQMNTDVNNGINDANKASTKDSSYANNHNAAQTAGYNGSFDGTQAGMSNAPYPDMTGKPQAYQDAYNNARNDAKKKAQEFAQTIANGGSVNEDQLTPAQKQAYEQGKQAMNDAINNAAQNNPANDGKYNGSDNASIAYQAAKAGYANAGNNPIDPDKAKDPIYNNAYKQAQGLAQQAAAKGLAEFASGANSSSASGTDALSKAQIQGFNQAKAGYNANPVDASNLDPSYQAGAKIKQDAQTGTAAAYNNPDQGAAYNNGSSAQNDAYAATVAGSTAGASGQTPDSMTGKSRAYQDAYNNAYQHANDLAKQAAAGKVDKNNLTNPIDQRSYATGVDAAKAGYNAAQENDSTKNNPNYSGNNNADMAYQGAQAGFTAGTNGTENKPTNSDPVYQKAYDDAYKAARNYAESGAQEFAQGKVAGHTDGSSSAAQNDALSAAQNSGYNQAQQGYDDQMNGHFDKGNTNPDYQKGAEMRRDTQAGQDYARTGSGPSEADSSIAQRDGYSGTIAGANDGASGANKPDMNGKSKAYQDSYNDAYNNAQTLAAKGAAGIPMDQSQLKYKTDQQAYARGIDDAKAGYQAAASQNGLDNNNQHHQADSQNATNLDKAYNGAIDGFKNGANGTDNPNSSDPVYTKAYSEAQQAAKNANENGIQEFMRGDTNSSANGKNDPISIAQNNAFTAAKAGYEAQMAGHVDDGNKTPGYLAGVQMAQQASKVANDANNNPDQVPSDDVAKAIHAATVAGYNNGSHNITDNTVPDAYKNQAKIYQDAYNAAHQNGMNAAQKGAQAFNNTGVKPSGNTAESLAEQQGYQDASDAYSKARETSVLPQIQDGSNYSDTYNGAADAFNNVLSGNYNAPTTGSTNYQAAYNKALNEAKTTIANAAMNNIKGSNETNSSLATDTISKLSNLGTTDAAQAYQAVLDKSDSYNHSDPNTDDVYKGAQAAFNDIQKGTANASRNNGNDLYQASYDKALAQAQTYAQKGADGYSNGQTVEDIINGLNNPTAAEKDAIQNGFNQANAGHDDSMNGVQHPSQNNPYYNNEFDNAKNAVNDGTKDAMNDATQGAQHSGNNKLDQAYNGTVDAYQDAGKTPRDIKHMSPAYKDAYNQAQADAQKAYADGAAQFNNDQSNDQSNNPGAAAIAHNNGYQAAQSIYNQMLQNPNSVDSSNLNPAQKVGYDKAQQSIAGLQDYASGKQPTSSDSNYMSGYNTAKQAAQAAMNDAQNGKPMNVVVPSVMNPQLYNDVYNATYNGYNNGYNGVNNKSNQGFIYDIAYKNAYQQGQYDVPVAPTLQPKVDQKTKPNRNSNKDAKNYTNVDQNTNKGILDAINGHKMKFGSTRPYKNGYNLGKEALRGMRAAEYGRKGKQHIKNAKDSFYMIGYSGYKNGVRAAKRTLKANKRLSKHDLVGKSPAYVYTFKQGLKAEKRHQHNLGYKQGVAMAKKVHAIPTRLAMTHSAQYVESYIKAYKRTMKHNMPKYVYNVRTIFVHKQLRFTNKNRVVRYAKMPRYKAKLLRVTGIAYYKNGIPRYRVVGGGMVADKRGTGIVAANDSIVNAYYRHNFKYFKVIKPKGTLTYKGMKFTKDNASHKVYHGEVFKVDKVIKYHGLTRFYLGHGQYITSNKTIVQKVG